MYKLPFPRFGLEGIHRKVKFPVFGSTQITEYHDDLTAVAFFVSLNHDKPGYLKKHVTIH